MKKYSLLFLIAGIGILILITQKVILPLVNDVVKSDAFLVDSNDQGSQFPISNTMSDLAFTHCNTYIKSELGSDSSVTFSEKPLKAWSLGNYQYVVNAEINITSGSNTATKKYACRITYENGDDLEGSNDFSNWSIIGIDGI
ncbi:hypothetical protein [Methyloglobulus sp.]|jgi:hypothetical protein|uniref:hypothetical protein n=1 Tax=Methyloglobulus sp. TaxID=2518622 RepID=UPI0032B78C43